MICVNAHQRRQRRVEQCNNKQPEKHKSTLSRVLFKNNIKNSTGKNVNGQLKRVLIR